MLSAVNEGVTPCSQVLLEVKLLNSRVVNSRPSQHTPAAPLQASDVSRSEAKSSVPAATLPLGQPCPRRSAGRDWPGSRSTDPSPAGFWGSWGRRRPARNWDRGPAPPGNHAHLSGEQNQTQMLSGSLRLERVLTRCLSDSGLLPTWVSFWVSLQILDTQGQFAHKISSGRIRRGLKHTLGKRSESSSVAMRR